MPPKVGGGIMPPNISMYSHELVLYIVHTIDVIVIFKDEHSYILYLLFSYMYFFWSWPFF